MPRLPASRPDGADRADSGSGVQAVLRSFDLLNTLAYSEHGLGLSEVVARSGVSMATAHRLLKTLELDGYVRQNSDRTYSLGPRLIELGRTASTLLPEWTDDYLAELVERTGETANLAVLDADEVVYVGQVRSQMRLQMSTYVGARLPAHCTAVGKTLLAALPDTYVESLLRRAGMTARTTRTVVDPDELMAQLAEVRQRGYSVDVQEQEDGVSCVAVPIRPAPRNMALSVSGPTERVTADRHSELAAILSEVAGQIAIELQQGGEKADEKSASRRDRSAPVNG